MFNQYRYRKGTVLMILRCRFTKLGDIAYISHLDLLKIFIRALRRSMIEVNYSEGFHPHPKISFSSALSLGIESYAEFIDIDIKNSGDSINFLQRMNESLPEGIDIIECKETEKAEPLTKTMSHSLYEIYFDSDNDGISDAIVQVMKSEELILKKRNKKKQIKDVNVREKIHSIEYDSEKNIIKTILTNSSEGALKPTDMLKAINENFGKEFNPYRIVKIASIMIADDIINII